MPTMKKIILILTIAIVPFAVKAQETVEKKKDKFRFSSQNYAGILEGESGTSLQVQTINGLRYKTWFAGVGTGLDYYYQRTIPLFLSVSKFLSSTKVPLYFNGDAGINFIWSK